MPTDLIQWLTSIDGAELKPFGVLLAGLAVFITLFARGTLVWGRSYSEKIETIKKLEGALELCNTTSEARALATFTAKEEFISYREARLADYDKTHAGGTPA